MTAVLTLLVKYWKPLVGFLLVGLILGGTYHAGNVSGRREGAAEVSALKLQHALETAEVARLAKIAAEEAAKLGKTWADGYIAIAARHSKELRDAESKSRAVVTGLRNGSLRLSAQWRCEVPAPAVAGGARSVAGESTDRAESAGRVVRAAAECDAQVRGLQSVLGEIYAGFDVKIGAEE